MSVSQQLKAYAYEAMLADGEIIHDLRRAYSQEAVTTWLAENGHHVLSIEEVPLPGNPVFDEEIDGYAERHSDHYYEAKLATVVGRDQRLSRNLAEVLRTATPEQYNELFLLQAALLEHGGWGVLFEREHTPKLLSNAVLYDQLMDVYMALGKFSALMRDVSTSEGIIEQITPETRQVMAKATQAHLARRDANKRG